MGVGGLGQREGTVDDRAHRSPVQHLHDLPHILLGAHVGSVDLFLLAEQQPQMKLGPQTGGSPADAVAAAGPQRGKGRGEEIGPHVVHHAVHPGAAGQLPDSFPDVFFRVVDDLVSPQFTGFGGLLRSAGGGDHPGAYNILRRLNRRSADAGRRRQHQNGLPRLELKTAHQHVPYRQVGGGDGGRLLEANVSSDGMDVGGRQYQVFGVAAVHGAAQEPGASAEVVLPRQAGRALLAAQPGIDHHTVAVLEPANPRSRLGYLAGAVAAQDQGRGELPLQAAAALPGVEVEAVQRGGPHPDHHLSRLYLRTGALTDGQYFRSAVGFDVDCLHRVALLNPNR